MTAALYLAHGHLLLQVAAALWWLPVWAAAGVPVALAFGRVIGGDDE